MEQDLLLVLVVLLLLALLLLLKLAPPAPLRGVCERPKHAKHPEPMQQAHIRPKHQLRIPSGTTLPTPLTHSSSQGDSWAARAGMEPPSPSLFLPLSLWRSSLLLLACAPGQVYPGVPVTDNLIINGPPGTQGLTPLHFYRGAPRSPGKIFTVLHMGFF